MFTFIYIYILENKDNLKNKKPSLETIMDIVADSLRNWLFHCLQDITPATSFELKTDSWLIQWAVSDFSYTRDHVKM